MVDTGIGDMENSTKEQSLSTPSHPPYQEWAAAFQAYYASGGLRPPGFFPPTVGSPHPYMWGAQPLMPPYGAPSSYAAVYAHGGMCTPPSMAPSMQVGHPYGPYNMPLGNACDAQGTVASTGTDVQGKANNGSSKCRRRKSKAGSEKIIKESDPHKGNSGCTDGGLSHSGDSGSEGSTQGSEEGSQNGSQVICKSNVDQVPLSIGGKQVVGGGPLTSLNIGVDYWSGGAPNLLASGKRGSSATMALISGARRDEILPQQDDRELKRERRKQSNRESARRSRMRKQSMMSLQQGWRCLQERMKLYAMNLAEYLKNTRNLQMKMLLLCCKYQVQMPCMQSLNRTAMFWKRKVCIWIMGAPKVRLLVMLIREEVQPMWTTV